MLILYLVIEVVNQEMFSLKVFGFRFLNFSADLQWKGGLTSQRLISLSHVTEFGYCKRSSNIKSKLFQDCENFIMSQQKEVNMSVSTNLSFRMTVRKTFAQNELKRKVTIILLFLILYYKLWRSGMNEVGTVFSKISICFTGCL